jgi:hypothetical protein
MNSQALSYLLKEIDKLREDQAIFLNGGGAKGFRRVPARLRSYSWSNSCRSNCQRPCEKTGVF